MTFTEKIEKMSPLQLETGSNQSASDYKMAHFVPTDNERVTAEKTKG